MGLIDDALAGMAGPVEGSAVAAQLGLPEAQVADIMEALAASDAGDPVAQAAARTGLDPATIRDVVSRIGVPVGARTTGDLLTGGGD